jgi:hypothetical protein
MGRPLKKALDYFNIEVDLDDKVQYLIAKHGAAGFGILVLIWRKCYGLEGYYCEWSERSKFVFARDNAVPIDELDRIVETCLSEGIFCREIFQKHSILTSHGIQKRYLRICTEAKRKDFHIEEKYELNPEKFQIKLEFPPEETEIPPSESAQSKVKESKVEETKVKEKDSTPKSNPPKVSSSAPAAGAGSGTKAGEKNGKEKQETRDFWQLFVDTWFAFYKAKHKGDEPNFLKRNPAHARDLYDLLKNRLSKKSIAWTAENMAKAFEYFLDQAYTNDPGKWLQNHFSLENLVKQFDGIYARAKEVKETKTFAQELDFLFNLYVDQAGYLDPRLITHEFYRKLEDKKLIPFGYRQKFEGTPEDQEVAAVKAFFERNKENKKLIATP